MLRILRRYNKWILVVGGSLLMVVFLLGGSLSRMGYNPNRVVIAELDGQKVRRGDLIPIGQQMQALQRFTPLLPQIIPPLSESTHDWFLVTHEADSLGFIGATRDGPDWIPTLANEMTRLYIRTQPVAQDQIPQVQEAFLRQLEETRRVAAGAGSMSLAQFDQALSAARGVFRMIEARLSAARVSDRRTIAEAKRLLDRAYIDYVVLDAGLLIDEVPEPDEQALAEHYAKYREVDPAENESGIGYIQPERIKLRWMKVDAQAIRDSVKANPIEAYSRWERNRDTYPGEWSEEKARVEAAMRQETVDSILQQVAQTVRTAVLTALGRLKTEGNYKVLPDDWQVPSFEAIADQIVASVKEQTGVDIPRPQVEVRESQWLTESDVWSLPGIGMAQARLGTQSIQFGRLAFEVKELGGQETLGLQVGVPVADIVVADRVGSRYFFAVTDAREQSPPDSLDEVRDQAVEDYRRVRAYDLLLERATDLKSLAETEGLRAVADRFNPEEEGEEGEESPPRKVTVRERLPVGIDPSSVRDQRLSTEEFCKAIMSVAEQIDPTLPPEEIDPKAATVSVPIPRSQSLALARITAYRPLTEEQFRLRTAEMAMRAQGEEIAELGGSDVSDPFSLKGMSGRLGYEFVGAGDEETDEPSGDREQRGPDEG